MKMLADALGISEDEVGEMEQRLEASDTSIDAPVNIDGGKPMSVAETMKSSLERPDDEVENAQTNSILREKIREFESTLRDRNLEIFRKRLMSDDPSTLVDLSHGFGVTRERVRQIENRLKEKLREYLTSELGDPQECLLP